MFPSKLLSQFAAIVIGGVYKEVDKSIFGREDDWVLISFPFLNKFSIPFQTSITICRNGDSWCT